MAQCPGCQKFPTLEFQEPELEGEVEVSEDLVVTATVRIERNSECCGELMKSATLEMEETLDASALFTKHFDTNDRPMPGHELEIEAEDPEQVEEGGGRYAKSYFGASIGYTIKCAKCNDTYTGVLTDKVAASGMDDEV